MKKTTEHKSFNLYPRCQIVYGAKRAAIYNFESGNVYSINKEGSGIIKEFCNRKINLNNKNNKTAIDFLLKLQKLGLGDFGKEKIKKEKKSKISIAPKPELKFLWIEPTSSCNLRCIHCYADSNNIIDKKELSTDDCKNIILEASKLGCKSLQFIGGEPFLREDIFDLIKFARIKKYSYVGIFTNATLLDKKKIKMLSDFNVDLKVSLYSHKPSIHDRITQVNGSFSKTLRAIKLITKYNIGVEIAIIIMKHNQNNIRGLRTFLKQLNIKFRMPDIIRPTGRGIDKLLFPTNTNIKELRILKRPDFMAMEEFFSYSNVWNSCWFGKLAITSSGNVIPCIFARSQIVGNIRNKNLAQILASNKLSKLWRITKDKLNVCRDCEYRYACKDCRPLSYSTFGNLYAKSPRCTYNPYKGVWQKNIS
ncbi:MAG: radical SAM protein [Candidatus Aureabacteria bacterium]|nr:radical SAM protein [Candidatus Auribacterota bacterium]